jgi:hypothetical protein
VDSGFPSDRAVTTILWSVSWSACKSSVWQWFSPARLGRLTAIALLVFGPIGMTAATLTA